MAKKSKAAAPADSSSSAPDEGVTYGDKAKTGTHSWAWPGVIVRNELNIFDGEKGVGKSSVMASLAVAIASGKRCPEAKSAGPKGRCLWFGSEEGFGKTILPRWVASGGRPCDLATVEYLPGNGVQRVQLPGETERLVHLVRTTKAKCLVIDPFTALAPFDFQTKDDQGSRHYLEAIASVARTEECTVLLARHLRKGRSGSVLEQGLGSVAISATCRSVVRLHRVTEPVESFWLSTASCNLGKAPGSFSYSLQPAPGHVCSVKWGKRSDETIEELLDKVGDREDLDVYRDAENLLRLALKDGPQDCQFMLKEAERAGIGIRTLRKAKTALGVKSKRIGGSGGSQVLWRWYFPK